MKREEGGMSATTTKSRPTARKRPMTGLRAARIQAGYRTAADAYKKFSRGRRGSEALSFSYFQLLEAKGPRLLSDPLARRFARFYGCSVNLIYAWQALPSTPTVEVLTSTTEASTSVEKGEDGTFTATRHSRRALAGARPVSILTGSKSRVQEPGEMR